MLFMFHFKNSFRFQDIQFFVILLLKLFPFKVEVEKWKKMTSYVLHRLSNEIFLNNSETNLN